MAQSIFPVPTSTSGDPASQTFAVTAAGTYTLSTSLAAGVYEITTDTVQSSFTLGLSDADGIKYTGTIRGGKGYISVASPVTKIVVPASMTYPFNINIRLGAYTQIAAPTGASFNWVANSGASVDFTFTPPANATNIVAYWRNGTSTTLGSTTSPITGVSIPGSYTTGNSGFAVLAAVDANGNAGAGVALTTTGTFVLPPISGGTISTYSSGGTNYLINTFLSSGTLTVNTTSTFDYFVVAGGGTGGYNFGGGGGGGGSTSGTKTSVAVGTYAVTVGAGGTGGANSATYGTQGGTSSIATPSAVSVSGGSAGGAYNGVNNSFTPGLNGGCGGGGGMGYGASAPQLAGGTASAGFAGGNGQTYGGQQGGGGGGGGGGSAGGNCVTGSEGGAGSGRPGAGGSGVSNSLRTGSAVLYAGGGGGAANNPTWGGGAAGSGGGTAGIGVDYNAAQSAAANTGGGSGGSMTGVANGGSGIVVVRVAI